MCKIVRIFYMVRTWWRHGGTWWDMVGTVFFFRFYDMVNAFLQDS